MKVLLIRALAHLRNCYYFSKSFLASLFIKTDKKYILFDSYAGLGFNDNPKAIFDFLLDTDYKLIWVFKNTQQIAIFNKQYPQHHAVKYNSLTHYKYLKKAQTWIFNYKTPPYFRKPKNTLFLQTWHGVPLKKLGCDIQDKQQRFYRSQQTYQQMSNSYVNEGNKCDYFIASSPYAKEKFMSAFKLTSDKIIETNYPRNIVLDKEKIMTLKKQLHLNKKVILYAPTWRDDSSSFSGYKNSVILDFNKMKIALGNDYQLLYRPHYLIKGNVDLSGLEDFVLDMSNYPDINDLFNIADILITDYSSVYFDYAILKKPIYFYMPDLVNYRDNLRDFYINIDTDLPNDYYLKQEDLTKAISINKINLEKQNNYYQHNLSYKLNLELIKEKLEL